VKMTDKDLEMKRLNFFRKLDLIICGAVCFVSGIVFGYFV